MVPNFMDLSEYDMGGEGFSYNNVDVVSYLIHGLLVTNG